MRLHVCLVSLAGVNSKPSSSTSSLHLGYDRILNELCSPGEIFNDSANSRVRITDALSKCGHELELVHLVREHDVSVQKEEIKSTTPARVTISKPLTSSFTYMARMASITRPTFVCLCATVSLPVPNPARKPTALKRHPTPESGHRRGLAKQQETDLRWFRA